jgi:hypothetical protein
MLTGSSERYPRRRSNALRSSLVGQRISEMAEGRRFPHPGRADKIAGGYYGLHGPYQGAVSE